MSTQSQSAVVKDSTALPTANQGDGNDGQTPFLRLSDDGDAFIVAFLGTPHLHAVRWDGVRLGANATSNARPSISVQHRIAVNVAVCELVPQNRVPSMRIQDVRVWDYSRKVHTQLLTLTRTFRTADWLFLVERQGKAYSQDTRYAILPVYALTSEDRKTMQSLPLHDLRALFGGDTRDGANPWPERIDATDLESLTTDLNRQPDLIAATKALCLHFEIQRIEQLPKADLPEAKAYLARLNGDASNPFE